MATLVDGGDRTNFDSGAMREIIDGKGRCDLLPLKQIAYLLGRDPKCNKNAPLILKLIDSYIYYGKTKDLYTVLNVFINENYDDPFTAMLELGKHYADGAKKYADRNWEKGLPLYSFIDSGLRHYFKFLRGDKDEPHDRAFMWNIFGAIWTQENHPECIDLPFADDVKDEQKVYADNKLMFSIECVDLPFADDVKKENLKPSDIKAATVDSMRSIFNMTSSFGYHTRGTKVVPNYDKCAPEQISSTCEGCRWNYPDCAVCLHSCHRANDGHLTGYTKSEPKPGRGWPL